MDPLEQKIAAALQRRPHTIQQLQNNLQVDNGRLRAALARMTAAGLAMARDGAYVPGPGPGAASGTPGQADGCVPCTLVKLAPRFGFAARADAAGEVFLPGRFLQGAMPGDEVLVRLSSHPREADKPEGEVVGITRPHNCFSGVVRRTEDGGLAVEPDGCPGVAIRIQPGQEKGARPEERVGIRLIARGTRHFEHRAAVEQRFGSSGCAAECARAILYAQSIDGGFPPAVLAQARDIPQILEPADTAGRLDLRGIPLFTIDSASTRDIDDAVSVMALSGGGYELGVHIADVSHYVRPGTPLDAEAMARATSLYYADQVIPMLPPELSNGVCSLNEGEDRLAFSCLIRLDADGAVTRYDFVKSVVRSRVKGVYKEVDLLLDGSNDPALMSKYAAVVGQLPAMRSLYEKRAALRRARDALDLDTGESKLVIGENGRCIDIIPQRRGLAECMIEEFMLLANQCAANAGRLHRAPFIYRVHEAPDPLRLQKLGAMLRACGIEPPWGESGPNRAQLAGLLRSYADSPRGQAVRMVVLRSMQKARYAPQPLGHYGLALQDYAHFTSPIRRYPDLAVHRILGELLLGAPGPRMQQAYAAYAEQASAIATRREALATRLERDIEACYMAEWMSAQVGRSFDGQVSGVTPHGVFVRLENGAEGFIPAAQLCQGEPEVQNDIRLNDPLTGKSWLVGDAVQVRVADANVALGRADLDLVQ